MASGGCVVWVGAGDEDSKWLGRAFGEVASYDVFGAKMVMLQREVYSSAGAGLGCGFQVGSKEHKKLAKRYCTSAVQPPVSRQARGVRRAAKRRENHLTAVGNVGNAGNAGNAVFVPPTSMKP
eukprot:scaffold1667_cov258-Pinguiococcus_pyrenoidosus.AAC.16